MATTYAMKVIIWLLLLSYVSGFNVHIGRVKQSNRLLQRSLTAMSAKLIVGVNKYSHDTSCCIIDSGTGKVVFTQAKERISNRKHDGGSAGAIVRYGLESVGAKLQDVACVVSNNHHFRVLPFEQRVDFNKALNYIPSEYDDEYNLFPDAEKMELSHHLAHAWSVVGTAPFDQGVALVMDGMGESRKAMIEDLLGLEEKSGDYMHDLKLLKSLGMEETDLFNHLALSPASTYREAETAYLFDRNKGIIKPVFKRWARERSPSELYNHGFENIDSIGKQNVVPTFMLCTFTSSCYIYAKIITNIHDFMHLLLLFATSMLYSVQVRLIHAFPRMSTETGTPVARLWASHRGQTDR